MKFKDRSYIGIYYNPETGLYARQTRKNYKNGKTFAWRTEEKLPPRFLPKITMLNLTELDTRIAGLGRRRKSQRHKGLFAYYLFGENWSRHDNQPDDRLLDQA